MASPRHVITDQPHSGQLSFIPGSREMSQEVMEHAQQHQTYRGSNRGSTLGSLQEPLGYHQREAMGELAVHPRRGSLKVSEFAENPRRGSLKGLEFAENPRRGSLKGLEFAENPRRGSLKGLEFAESSRRGSLKASALGAEMPRRGSLNSRRGSVMTTQPGYNSRLGNPECTFFSDGSSMDGVFLREMAGLGQFDTIRIQQQMEIDLKGGCGHGNSYDITSIDGDKIFTAAEDANCFCRWVCGPSRSTHITVYDNDDRPVLHFDRDCCRCDCCCCCAGCCLGGHRLTIRDARGRVVGTIKEKFHVFQLRLHLVDADDNVAMQVLGPCCPLRCCSEMTFDIMNSTGLKEIGYILKKWDNNVLPEVGEVDTDHENIEITMPQFGNVEERVLVLGATLLANFMYMEMS